LEVLLQVKADTRLLVLSQIILKLGFDDKQPATSNQSHYTKFLAKLQTLRSQNLLGHTNFFFYI
jgi:hypothetical protein